MPVTVDSYCLCSGLPSSDVSIGIGVTQFLDEEFHPGLCVAVTPHLIGPRRGRWNSSRLDRPLRWGDDRRKTSMP